MSNIPGSFNWLNQKIAFSRMGKSFSVRAMASSFFLAFSLD
jgi:hypothetical protein